MADYYPLIARAIAGLDPSAPGESRRALYERARTALIQQLRSVQPPLSESEITRERLSLEEAVRKVEAEAAQRAREVSRAAPRGEPSRRANPRPPEGTTPPAPARAPAKSAIARQAAVRRRRPDRTPAARVARRGPCEPAPAGAAEPAAGSTVAADPRTPARPQGRGRRASATGRARLPGHRSRCR